MTFPVGRYPNAGEIAVAFVPSKSAVFTHGGSDFDCTDTANKLAPMAKQFTCTATGNFVFSLAGDMPEDGSVTRTLALNAGDVFYGAIVLVKGSSTADGILFA